MSVVDKSTETLTVQEFLKHFDTGACELVRGKVVRMSPRLRHGRRAAWIVALLFTHVEPRQLGTVASELSFLIAAEPDTARVPDVLFISYASLPPEAVAALEESEDVLSVPPELVVEILSPDDRWTSVEGKVEEYLHAGVRLIWVVNPAQKTVHIYRPDQAVRRLTAEQTITGEDVLPEFSVTVDQLCTVGSVPISTL